MSLFRWVGVFCTLLFSGLVFAADIFVTPSNVPAGGAGNGSPSLSAAAHKAHKGDTIHLLRGGIYRDGNVSIEGATVVADGPADQPAPVVTGAQPISGFHATPENSKIFAAPCPSKPTLCAVDNHLLTLARYPNEGFLTTKAGTTANAIVDAELGKRSGSNAKGAQVHWRKWSWWWEARTVLADGGGKLELGPSPVPDLAGLVGIGAGYFIDDCRAELDAPGEWWYDAAKKELLVIPPAGSDPNKLVVEAAQEKNGVHLNNAKVHGIHFCHYVECAVNLDHASTLEDCTVDQVWDTGITGGWDSAGSVVRNCTLTDILNIGIRWNEKEGEGGSVIEHNRLERIGMRDGLGGSGTWHACGMIISHGKAVSVRFNTLVDTGYCGIILGHDGQVVEHNVFVRCMSTMNDGAAIYANCSATVIRGNIILNSVGNLKTSQPFYPLGQGIWPEFLKEFHDTKIIGNTVFGCGGNGIFMPNNFNCDVQDNVLAGNRMAGLSLGTTDNIKKPQGHKITGNVFVIDPRLFTKPSWTENIPVDWMGNDHPRGVDFEKSIDFGAMSGTTFVLAPKAILAKPKDGNAEKDPAAWKASAAWADGAAKVIPGQAILLINDTETAANIPTPSGPWALLSGERPGASVKVEPFATAVLVSAAPVPPNTPGYILASGRDFSSGASNEKVKPNVVAAAATAKTDEAKKQHEQAENKVKQDASRAVPKKESWDAFVKDLRECTQAAISAGHPPRFNYSALKAEVDVVNLNSGHATLRIAGESSTFDADLFTKIETVDALALTRALARNNTPEDHARIAFFARCAGDFKLAEKNLAEAGAGAEKVTAGFAEP